MKISVKAAHIAKGRPGNCRTCAVALALAEATGHEWQVHPELILRWVGSGETLKRIAVKTPTVVEEFIARFDGGETMRPFSFEFNPPVEVAVAC